MAGLSDSKEKFMYTVINFLDKGIKPTPKKLNEELGRQNRQQFTAWECVCRVELMKFYGYSRQKNGRWELNG